MTIRKIGAGEVGKLNHLYYESDEFVKQRQDKILDGSKDIFILLDEDKIIGEVTIVYGGYDECVVSKNRVNMEALRILPGYQNRGLGQYFVKEIIELLQTQGYREITIGVEDDNLIAKHIYNKLGFTEFLRREKPNRYAPNGYDLLLKRIR